MTKYGYPRRLANSGNYEESYIRQHILNAGTLYIFYRVAVLAAPGGCVATCTPVTMEDCIWVDPGGDDDAWQATVVNPFSGKTSEYRFFLCLNPFFKTSLVDCFDWLIRPTTTIEVLFDVTNTYLRRRTYDPWDIPCKFGAPLTVTPGPSMAFQDGGTFQDTILLGLHWNISLAEAETLWDTAREGKGGAFPYQGQRNANFAIAYGEYEGSAAPYCDTYTDWSHGLNCDPMASWKTSYSSSGKIVDLTYDIDLQDIKVYIKEPNQSAWVYTGIWSGNEQGAGGFDGAWFAAHVFDLDA